MLTIIVYLVYWGFIVSVASALLGVLTFGLIYFVVWVVQISSGSNKAQK